MAVFVVVSLIVVVVCGLAFVGSVGENDAVSCGALAIGVVVAGILILLALSQLFWGAVESS